MITIGSIKNFGDWLREKQDNGIVILTNVDHELEVDGTRYWQADCADGDAFRFILKPKGDL